MIAEDERDDTPLRHGDKVWCEHPVSGEAFEGQVVQVEDDVVTVQPAFAMFHKKMRRQFVRRL